MYKITFHQQALKDLQKISKENLKAIKKRIWKLKDTPRSRDCKKLKGLSGLHRLRSGNYRIIYLIQEKVVTILIINVRRRKEAYRNL